MQASLVVLVVVCLAVTLRFLEHARYGLAPEATEYYRNGKIELHCGFKVWVYDLNPEKRDTILTLHGFPVSSFDFARLIPYLVKTHRIVLFDMVGFGQSERRWLPIMQQADVALSVWRLRSISLSESKIVAHDYGCTVMQEILARMRRRDAPLFCIMLNAGLFPAAHRPMVTQRVAARFKLVSKPWVRCLTFKRIMLPLFAHISSTDLETFWSIVSHEKITLVDFLEYMKERLMHEERWTASLRHFACILVIVIGEDDPVAGLSVFAMAGHLLPEAELIRLGNVGHWPHWEAPDTIAKIIKAFDFI